MVSLQIPGYSPTSGISIKDPDLLDNLASAFNLEINVTQTGKFKTTFQEKLDSNLSTLEFSQLSETEKDTFLTFLIEAQDHYIRYTDYNSKVWIIQLVGDGFTISNSPAGYNVSLEIQRWEL